MTVDESFKVLTELDERRETTTECGRLIPQRVQLRLHGLPRGLFFRCLLGKGLAFCLQQFDPFHRLFENVALRILYRDEVAVLLLESGLAFDGQIALCTVEARPFSETAQMMASVCQGCGVSDQPSSRVLQSPRHRRNRLLQRLQFRRLQVELRAADLVCSCSSSRIRMASCSASAATTAACAESAARCAVKAES